ncbi:hypothetical protein, partial [Streptococcus pneumoniae]|uniref:hypothetical protein n=1 Tax=Streptococcus pneumoniae TaxID=1313 RepID=UPI001EF765E7
FYLSGFITRLQQEIYATYIELFPQNFLSFQPSVSSIQQKKCGHILDCFKISFFHRHNQYFLHIGLLSIINKL